jgi:hypothetical protein
MATGMSLFAVVSERLHTKSGSGFERDDRSVQGAGLWIVRIRPTLEREIRGPTDFVTGERGFSRGGSTSDRPRIEA